MQVRSSGNCAIRSRSTGAAFDPLCAGQGPTVWYEYTPAENGSIDANTFGSNYDTTLSVYVGARGSLLQIACNDDSGSLQSKVIVPVSAGETYFFMVGSFFGGPGGSLEFTVQENIPLAIDVTIDARGSVVPKEGVATVRGTYSCTKPAEVQVFGELRQRAGRAIITGWCTPRTSPVMGTARGRWRRFRPTEDLPAARRRCG